jgi:hypothetical protein
MNEHEQELLARIVEMLLNDTHQPMLAKSGLLNAAHLAGVTKRLPGWTENQPGSQKEGGSNG